MHHKLSICIYIYTYARVYTSIIFIRYTILYEARAKYVSRSLALLFDVMPRKTIYNEKNWAHIAVHGCGSFESYRHGFCTCSLITDRHRCRRRQRLRSDLFAWIYRPPGASWKKICSTTTTIRSVLMVTRYMYRSIPVYT